MPNSRERYSRLAPFSLEDRIQLAKLAVHVFSLPHYQQVCEVIGKTPEPSVTRPLSTGDFLTYLEKMGALPEAMRWMFRIRELLAQLVAGGVLDEVARGRDPFLGQHYYLLKEFTTREGEGWLWLAPALGADFIHHQYATVTVQLTGISSEGDAHAGTGLVLSPTLILTCGHVIADIALNTIQELQGRACRVVHTLVHPTVDVGLVEIDGTLTCLPAIAFKEPSLAEQAFVLGYPKIHYTREAALLLHRGEVTNPSVTTLDGHRVFLYSAIARPGNSGGPIISRSGHVIGLVTKELSAQSPERAAPFYAGVPTGEIAQALSDLDARVHLPIEDFS